MIDRLRIYYHIFYQLDWLRKILYVTLYYHQLAAIIASIAACHCCLPLPTTIHRFINASVTLSFSKFPNQLSPKISTSLDFWSHSTSNLDNELSPDSSVNDNDRQLAEEGNTYAEEGDTFAEEGGDMYKVDSDKLESVLRLLQTSRCFGDRGPILEP